MFINKNWCYNFGGPCDSDQTGLSRGLPIHILQSLIMFKYFFCIYIYVVQISGILILILILMIGIEQKQTMDGNQNRQCSL